MKSMQILTALLILLAGCAPGENGSPSASVDETEYQLMDVHGAGAQRSDPKSGDPDDYPAGMGPQGDVLRIYNLAILVRGNSTKSHSYPVVDTAQTGCYDDSREISPPASDGDYYGQDAQYSGLQQIGRAHV